MKRSVGFVLSFVLWIACVGCGPQSTGDADAPLPEMPPEAEAMDPAAMQAEAEAAAAAAESAEPTE